MSAQSQDHQEPEAVTRREVLKAMAAVTGAAALAGLPSKWKKPVVQVGALPAHAQGTIPTANLDIIRTSGRCINQFNQWDVYFVYDIPGGAKSFELIVEGQPNGCEGILEGTPKLEKTGDSFSGSGKWTFLYKVKEEEGACTSVRASVKVTDNNGKVFIDAEILDPLLICEAPPV